MSLISRDERLRICFRQLINEDYKAFRKNIFKINQDPEYIRETLLEIYSSVLGFSERKNFIFHFNKLGKTSNESYIDYFSTKELRTVSLAFYYFNKEFDPLFEKYELTSTEIDAIIQKAVDKAIAKTKCVRDNYRVNIQPIIKTFNGELKKGLLLCGDVFKPNSTEEQRTEFNNAIADYNSAFADFNFILRDFSKESIFYILKNLNKGFYNSNFGMIDNIEPMFLVQSKKKECLSKSLLRNNTYKLNHFVDLYKLNEDTLTDLMVVAKWAEGIGNEARETIKQIQGFYPEFQDSFTNLHFANNLKSEIPFTYEKESQTL